MLALSGISPRKAATLLGLQLSNQLFFASNSEGGSRAYVKNRFS